MADSRETATILAAMYATDAEVEMSSGVGGRAIKADRLNQRLLGSNSEAGGKFFGLHQNCFDIH